MSAESLPVLVTALPIGVAFGIVLEQTGLGDPRVIAGQLTGRDFTVVRVMIGAIVTAMLGLVWGSAAGWIDLTSVAVPPTEIAAQLVGAVIFGGGFALAALCPGTACVAASSGRRDGVAAVIGMLGGTVLTAVVWPVFRGVTAGGPREGATLPDDLGLPLWIIVLGVTALGVVSGMLGRRFDRRGSVRVWRLTTGEVGALTLALAFAVVDTRGALSRDRLAGIAAEITREADHIDALDLAAAIRAGTPGLRIVDVRDDVDPAIPAIPGAEIVPIDRLTTLRVSARETVVLYSEGGAHAAQAWVLLRARGIENALVLKDGLAAWEDEVLAPLRPAVADDTAQARFRRARELAVWFGGMPRLVPLPDDIRAATSGDGRRRRNTC